MCKFSGMCGIMDIQTGTKTSCISQTVNVMSSSLAVMTLGSGHLLSGCGTMDLEIIRVFFRNHLCKSMTLRRVELLTAQFRKLFKKRHDICVFRKNSKCGAENSEIYTLSSFHSCLPFSFVMRVEPVGRGIAQQVSLLGSRLVDRGIYCRQYKEVFLFSEPFRSPLRPTYPCVQCVPVALFCGVGWLDVKLHSA
jgi:hypothetical protein